MRRSSRVLASGLVAAGMMLAAVGLPASAAQFQGTGFYGVWDDTDIVGIVVVDRTGAATPRYSVSGSREGVTEQLSLNFRSIGCNGTPSAGNRVFRVQVMTDANGAIYERGSLSPSINFDAVKSVWVNGGSCVRAEHFERVATGDVNGDGALGIMADKATPKLIVAVRSTSNAQALVTVVIDGKNANEEFSVRGSNKSCGRPSPASSWYVPDMDSDQSGMAFESTTVSLTKEQTGTLASVRLRSLTTGKSWCAPLGIIMANTEGDG